MITTIMPLSEAIARRNRLRNPVNGIPDPGIDLPVKVPMDIPRELLDRISSLEHLTACQRREIKEIRAELVKVSTAVRKANNKPLTVSPVVNAIIATIADSYDVDPAEIIGSCKNRYITEPRYVAVHIARKVTGKSYPELGRLFKKHHSSLLAGLSLLETGMAEKPSLKLRVEKLTALCGASNPGDETCSSDLTTAR